jgi:uncharacterized YccA/Bax inhibitor family protein
VRSSNPVLTRLGPLTGRGGYASTNLATADRMTIDDVVVRSVGLLALTVASAAITWTLVPIGAVFTTWIIAMMVGIGLGFVISFSRMTSPAVVCAYAVVEGVFLGAVSKAYEYAYSGIVLEAILGTAGLYVVMALLYKSQVIRATPRFVRVLTAITAGAVVLVLGNLVLYFFGINTALNGNGPIAFLFALAMIVIGALNLIADFDLIERGVASGMPKRFAWTCAFALLVSLIWIYLYVIRLLGIVRSN